MGSEWITNTIIFFVVRQNEWSDSRGPDWTAIAGAISVWSSKSFLLTSEFWEIFDIYRRRTTSRWYYRTALATSAFLGAMEIWRAFSMCGILFYWSHSMNSRIFEVRGDSLAQPWFHRLEIHHFASMVMRTMLIGVLRDAESNDMVRAEKSLIQKTTDDIWQKLETDRTKQGVGGLIRRHNSVQIAHEVR
jgi:hypothetical protein